MSRPVQGFTVPARVFWPALVLLLVLSVAALWWTVRDPDTFLLAPDGPAQWIRHDEAFYLKAWEPGALMTQFRTGASLDSGARPVLSVTATGPFLVWVNGERVADSHAVDQPWNVARRIAPGEAWQAGPNTVHITATRENGPVLLRVRCDTHAQWTTGAGTWQSSLDGETWQAARRAGDLPLPPISRAYPWAGAGFARTLPWLILLLAAAGGAWFLTRRHAPAWAAALATPSALRWLLLAAWAVLGVNNLAKIPAHTGMDLDGHMAYIAYVARTWRTPLANEGWQMFQSPLYYYLSAPLYLLASAWAKGESLAQVMRVIPFLCGAAQVELGYRTARAAFPGAVAPQAAATLIAGLMPMNLYISQAAGNEPLCGVLSAGGLLLAVHVLRQPETASKPAAAILAGLLLAGALLAKATAVLLIPLAGLAVLLIAVQRESHLRGLGRNAALAGAIVIVLAGWYYGRNWFYLGKPFVGGWDPERGIVWWQDPGYRTWGQMLGFGRALVWPVYASTAGFLDSWYSTLWLDGSLSGMVTREGAPPWNANWLVASAWWSLPATGAILAGCWRAMPKPGRRVDPVLVLALAAAALYGAALFHHFLATPFHSSGKATYMLGLTPLLGVLAAAGAQPLTKMRWGQVLVAAWAFCWGVAAYAAYFVG